MRRFWILGLMLIAGAALLASCAKRSNKFIVITSGKLFTIPAAPSGGSPPISSTSLSGNKFLLTDASGKRTIHAYFPPGHPTVTGVSSQQRYPALYLLGDFDQTSEQLGKFYQIQALMDDLIANQEVDSLVVFLIGGDEQNANINLGGCFFANNLLIGDWSAYIAEDLIPALDTIYLNFRLDVNRRAIAGLGMGGYGAFRLALEYPTKFKVVGAMSAPLALGGSDPAGWLDSYLRPTALAENGNNFANLTAVDPFDPAKPATSWMFAMASAFAARSDTLDQSGTTYKNILGTNYGVDLFFDGAGMNPAGTNIWMGWDIENLLNTTYAGALTGKKVYLDCGNADEFNFDAVNLRFSQFLTTNNITHSYFEYPGYDGHDAMHGDFNYDRLKELFKFVSANM